MAKFYTPTVTALDADGGIDIAGNTAILDHCIRGGVDGLVVLGSTGEFPSLTDRAQRELIDLATGHVAGRAELIIGTARMRLEETIDLSNFALRAGGG